MRAVPESAPQLESIGQISDVRLVASSDEIRNKFIPDELISHDTGKTAPAC
jgi:hypothetical protein